MAFGEIHLTPSDSDSYSVGATITNAVRYGDYFQLVYHGRDPENGETYEGTIRLERRLGEQSIEAHYTNQPRSSAPERRCFILVGSFIDSSYTFFDGLWIDLNSPFIAVSKISLPGRAEKWIIRLFMTIPIRLSRGSAITRTTYRFSCLTVAPSHGVMAQASTPILAVTWAGSRMAGYLTKLVSACFSLPKPQAGRLSQHGMFGQLVVPAVRVQHAERVKHVQRGRHDHRPGFRLAARRTSISSQGKPAQQHPRPA
jgi:hypothetical protein